MECFTNYDGFGKATKMNNLFSEKFLQLFKILDHFINANCFIKFDKMDDKTSF